MVAVQVTCRYYAMQYTGDNAIEIATEFGGTVVGSNSEYMDLTWSGGPSTYRIGVNEWFVWRNLGTHKEVQGTFSTPYYENNWMPLS